MTPAIGFHLATLDIRQSSDQHEAVVAELLRVARVEPDYSALGEAQRRALLLRSRRLRPSTRQPAVRAEAWGT